MRKCIHGVYIPAGSSDDISPYCSGCTVPDPLPPGATLSSVFSDPLPHGKKTCPRCGSKKFKYKNDWEFSCPKCGFDALS